MKSYAVQQEALLEAAAALEEAAAEEQEYGDLKHLTLSMGKGLNSYR